MLHWLVHDNGTICILHITGVSTIIIVPYAIPNCDCGQGISYYSTYFSRLCFSDIDRFCVNLVLLVSAELFAVWVSLQLMPFNVIWGWRILLAFAVLLAARLPLQLRLGPNIC